MNFHSRLLGRFAKKLFPPSLERKEMWLNKPINNIAWLKHCHFLLVLWAKNLTPNALCVSTFSLLFFPSTYFISLGIIFTSTKLLKDQLMLKEKITSETCSHNSTIILLFTQEWLGRFDKFSSPSPKQQRYATQQDNQ